MPTPRYFGRRRQPGPWLPREYRPLALALLPSLLVHALLLSLSIGGQEPGLPGFDFPWRDRRVEAPPLRVMLPEPEAAAVVAAPVEAAPTEIASPDAPGLVFLSPPASVEARSPLTTEAAAVALPAAEPAPDLIALEPAKPAPFVVPVPPPLPAQPVAVASSASSPATEEAAQQEAARVEAARIESARLQAERQESERQAAARLAQARQEAARLEAARLETERQEAARQAAALLASARQEAARVEAARLEAARIESARLETERQEAERQAAALLASARQEAARIEAARQEAAKAEAARETLARQEAARLQAAQQDEERRIAVRKAMGRQLDAEAAQRDAAANASRASGSLPSSWSSARRGRLFGRADPNAELVLYAEAWARRIQLNTSVDVVREATARPHVDPLVTVAIRSDGSIESVSFVLSSGVPEIDEAIRRIVQGLTPHPAFPPALARQFDVIEIRRTWYFDSAIRLF